jgi:hypothetical protein
MLIFRQPSPRPKLSGKWSALLLFFCLAVVAIAIPNAAHLPKWIEFEIVAGVWWLVWTLVLAYLLFNAHEVEDDVSWATLRKKNVNPSGAERDGCGSKIFAEVLFDGGCCLTSIFDAGAAIAFVVLTAAGILISFDILIPGLAFLLYLAIRGMLARALNPTRSCEGNAPLALLWGMIWATAYTAPVALIVWVIKLLAVKTPV